MKKILERLFRYSPWLSEERINELIAGMPAYIREHVFGRSNP